MPGRSPGGLPPVTGNRLPKKQGLLCFAEVRGRGTRLRACGQAKQTISIGGSALLTRLRHRHRRGAVGHSARSHDHALELIHSLFLPGGRSMKTRAVTAVPVMVIGLLIIIVALFPVYWMMAAAVKTENQIFAI